MTIFVSRVRDRRQRSQDVQNIERERTLENGESAEMEGERIVSSVKYGMGG